MCHELASTSKLVKAIVTANLILNQEVDHKT